MFTKFSEFEKNWYASQSDTTGPMWSNGQFEELPFWEYREYCEANDLVPDWSEDD